MVIPGARRRKARGRTARQAGYAALLAALLVFASACDGMKGISLPAGPSSATVAAPPPIAVPDVTGQAGDIARDTLEHAGFVVKFKDGLRNRKPVITRNWTVTAQEPSAGEDALPGDEVTLTVQKTAELEPPPAPPDPTPQADSSSAGKSSPSPEPTSGP